MKLIHLLVIIVLMLDILITGVLKTEAKKKGRRIIFLPGMGTSSGGGYSGPIIIRSGGKKSRRENKRTKRKKDKGSRIVYGGSGASVIEL